MGISEFSRFQVFAGLEWEGLGVWEGSGVFSILGLRVLKDGWLQGFRIRFRVEAGIETRRVWGLLDVFSSILDEWNLRNLWDWWYKVTGFRGVCRCVGFRGLGVESVRPLGWGFHHFWVCCF